MHLHLEKCITFKSTDNYCCSHFKKELHFEQDFDHVMPTVVSPIYKSQISKEIVTREEGCVERLDQAF